MWEHVTPERWRSQKIRRVDRLRQSADEASTGGPWLRPDENPGVAPQVRSEFVVSGRHPADSEHVCNQVEMLLPGQGARMVFRRGRPRLFEEVGQQSSIPGAGKPGPRRSRCRAHIRIIGSTI